MFIVDKIRNVAEFLVYAQKAKIDDYFVDFIEQRMC